MMPLIPWSVPAVLLLASCSAVAGNFAECILDDMPGASNGVATGAVFRSCSQSFPGQYHGVVKGSGKGLFGFKNGNECTIKKAKATTFQPAASAISVACGCLYDLPQFDGQTCANFFEQLNNR